MVKDPPGLLDISCCGRLIPSVISLSCWAYLIDWFVQQNQIGFWLVVYLSLWKMMEFVSWDDFSILNWMESHKFHVPNQQPGLLVKQLMHMKHPNRTAVECSCPLTPLEDHQRPLWPLTTATLVDLQWCHLYAAGFRDASGTTEVRCWCFREWGMANILDNLAILYSAFLHVPQRHNRPNPQCGPRSCKLVYDTIGLTNNPIVNLLIQLVYLGGITLELGW